MALANSARTIGRDRDPSTCIRVGHETVTANPTSPPICNLQVAGDLKTAKSQLRFLQLQFLTWTPPSKALCAFNFRRTTYPALLPGRFKKTARCAARYVAFLGITAFAFPSCILLQPYPSPTFAPTFLSLFGFLFQITLHHTGSLQ